jgi:ubiquitin carboxyl-terminal hydrolase 5/13
VQYFIPSAFRSKLGIGLLSGKYSKAPPEASKAKQTDDELQPGISPHMFKSLIGRGHPLFSTKRQQDAQEFFLHFINTLEVKLDQRTKPVASYFVQATLRIKSSRPSTRYPI